MPSTTCSAQAQLARAAPRVRTTVRLKLTDPQRFVLRLADTCLIHAQRLAEWCGHGPVLEEDIALTNMALDLLGQSRALFSHVAQLLGPVSGSNGGPAVALDEDDLAFWREEHDFFNFTLVEQPLRRSSGHAPGGDFADTVLRNFLLASWLKLLWTDLQSSSDTGLAAIAAKALKEARYHQQHAGDWVVRLGDGSAESKRRMAAALQRAWPYTHEMFVRDAVDEAAANSGLGPARDTLQARWHAEVTAGLNAATLTPPASTPFVSTGTQGRHSEHLGYLLAEMQSLQRQHPGGRW